MSGRRLIAVLAALAVSLPVLYYLKTPQDAPDATAAAATQQEKKDMLTPEQTHVLRNEGTEPAFSSPLNKEKRKGMFVCAGCGQPLFPSDVKYDSGTGWPSFSDALPGAILTKTDYKLGYARTEYHCAKCGGHQGHVFNDGPGETGLRYCNNGLALRFVPEDEMPKQSFPPPPENSSTTEK